jgi:large subunit ribosomal protein L24e
MVDIISQVFRFSTSKNESLFLQRKNPRKISWTVPYRRLHKKGITEEVAKKRSRKTVKHQRGIVGADMASILAKRNQSTQVRTAQRTAAIQKAKSEKKEKEAKKTKVRFHCPPHRIACTKSICEGLPTSGHDGTQNLKAAGEGRKGWPLVVFGIPDSSSALSICIPTHRAKYIHLYKRRLSTFSDNSVSINEA